MPNILKTSKMFEIKQKIKSHWTRFERIIERH